ncbi:MAG: GNAT family N-acetyltransferase, partial [Victivallales bacterium]|nr:GNAT family N-acetyltransferase [Victivallales bacterium]
MEIRKLNAQEHLQQYNDLLRYAFQVTEKQLLDYGWENEDIRQSKLPVLEKARVIGCFDQQNLASQFAVYPLKMNIFGTVCKIGFVTSVSTYPEYTGQGLMSRLMRESLETMRSEGESLAILYPFSIPLYRYRGWEVISDKMTFRIKDNQLPKKMNGGGCVRRVSIDSPELKQLHNKFASQTHGCLMRNDLAWGEYWRWDVEDTSIAVFYDDDKVANGYMVYLLKDDTMYIKEMIYLNINAWRGLWKYISAHESMVYEVVGNNYFNEPMAFWLDDCDIKETIRPYIMG